MAAALTQIHHALLEQLAAQGGRNEAVHTCAVGCAAARQALPTTGARAVDNVTSSDAPDLTSVRAKIKAKDFKGALAELTPMLATHQHADVYNLMGFSLRKTGDYSQAYTFYRKALDFDPGAQERARISRRALCRDRADREGARERRAAEEALPERLRGA